MNSPGFLDKRNIFKDMQQGHGCFWLACCVLSGFWDLSLVYIIFGVHFLFLFLLTDHTHCPPDTVSVIERQHPTVNVVLFRECMWTWLDLFNPRTPFISYLKFRRFLVVSPSLSALSVFVFSFSLGVCSCFALAVTVILIFLQATNKVQLPNPTRRTLCCM